MKKTLIFVTVVFAASTIFLSCQKEKTYSLEIKDGVRYVHNLKPNTESSGIGLEFILQIGELEPEDENYLFSTPLSAAEDEAGNIYILDTKECCVKKFTSDGVYISQFGRTGQGPGEFEYPQAIDCRSERLLVVTSTSWIHLFDLNGGYIERFRLPQYQGLFLKFMNSDKVVGYSMQPGGENNKENRILKINDLQGNILQDFGEPFLVDKVRSSWVANFPKLAVDSQDNIYVAFERQNRIEKYSGTGELLMNIKRLLSFDLEYKYKKETREIQGKVREYEREDFPRVNRGIGVDSRGWIWVLVGGSSCQRILRMKTLSIKSILYLRFLARMAFY